MAQALFRENRGTPLKKKQGSRVLRAFPTISPNRRYAHPYRGEGRKAGFIQTTWDVAHRFVFPKIFRTRGDEVPSESVQTRLLSC